MPELTDKEFIHSQKLWPKWPFLPMKRDKPGDNKELGCLFAVEGMESVIVKVNLWQIRGPLGKVIQEHGVIPYPSVDAMLADGWIVD